MAEKAGEVKEKNKGSWKNMLKLWSYVLPYRMWFGAGMVFLLLSTLTSLSMPWLIGQLVDSATDGDSALPFEVNQIALIMGGILLLQAFFSYARIFTFAQVSERAISHVRRDLYNKLVSLPIVFFEKHRVGELTSRITSDVAQLQDMLSLALAEFFRQIATLIIGITVMLVISPALTIRMLLIIPLMAVLAMYFGRFIRKLSKERQDALADSNIVAEESLQNIQMVKAFTNEPHEIGRYADFQDRVVRFALRAAHYRGLFTSFIIFAGFGGIILMLWYGVTLVQSGAMTIGELTTFIFYTMFIGGSISGMGELYARIQRTLGASERVLDMLREDSELDVEVPLDDSPIGGNISYRGIHFAYPTRTDITVLDDFDLEIASGEKIALAGHSGSGKSTIVQLLLGFYQLQQGEILVDGVDISSLNPRKLRSSIAIVPQEVILFGGTIRENIAYGRTGATEQEITAAAQKANAWEFIEQFPEGLETVVGERGVKLSGGQRQRVAIARAILKDPAILILDEATSSLDAASESVVQDALENLMEGRTTIVIAHRLSTIRNVDRIYVLHKGQIEQTGSYDQLAADESGTFHRLLKLQFEQQENPASTPSA